MDAFFFSGVDMIVLTLSLDLPSFLWLWKIAAWSMGFCVTSYLILAILGGKIWLNRLNPSGSVTPNPVLRNSHYLMGLVFLLLVLLLFSIGILGTIGHFGNLGHSPHLFAGLLIVTLAILSAITGSKIKGNESFRSIHRLLNLFLFFSLTFVGWSGWLVVQKYL